MKFHNPITMRGKIDRCWLFTFRSPVEQVETFLPSPLKPVVRDGFGFWNVVVCRLSSMRPKLIPAVFGISYWHAAYRIHAFVNDENKQRKEGLYFVRSDCNKPWLAKSGNILTDFNFHYADISFRETPEEINLAVTESEANASIVVSKTKEPKLTGGSPFQSLEEAGDFLKYKPRALSAHNNNVYEMTISRNENEWHHKPVHVDSIEWEFFKDIPVEPEVCFEVRPIEYQWNRGRRVASMGGRGSLRA